MRNSSEWEKRDLLHKLYHGARTAGELYSDYHNARSFKALLEREGASEEECKELEALAKKERQKADVADLFIAASDYLANKKQQHTVKDSIKFGITTYVDQELQKKEITRIKQEEQIEKNKSSS